MNIIKSLVTPKGQIELPLIQAEISMIPFDLQTLRGVPIRFAYLVQKMLEGIPNLEGTAYFTIHGKKLLKGQTLRRGGAHIDGNYEPVSMGFGSGGGSGWKVGEDGYPINTAMHDRQYMNPLGGIIMASNYTACVGYSGEFNGIPNIGGDCTHIELNEPLALQPDRIYYGNNHFIHESLPMADNVHRVMARITLPEDHIYQG